MSERTNDAVKILHDRIKHDPERVARVEEEFQRLKLFQLILTMRKKSGITQTELAKRMGTTQSVISRIESGNYSGITINTLLKAVSVMNYRLNISAEAI